MPFFTNNEKTLCHLTAFKHIMVMGFWKAKALNDPNKILIIENKAEMGHLGKISSMNDMPKDAEIVALLKSAHKSTLEI